MDPHRALLRPQGKLPPRTPWWRLLWASIKPRGPILRLWERNAKRRVGIVRDPEAWARRRSWSYRLGEPIRITRPGFTVGGAPATHPMPPPVPLPGPAARVLR